MSKIYPTAASENFLICDDIRREHGSKFSFLGVFPGNVVYVGREKSDELSDQPLVLESLACYSTYICEAEESYRLTIELLNPSGEREFLHKDELHQPATERRISIIFKLNQFTVKQFGEYKAIVKFDDRAFECKFSILKKP